MFLLSLLILTFSWHIWCQSLFETLDSIGASQFAASIQADDVSFALFSGGTVRTVYAPKDGPSLTRRQSSENRRRQTNSHGQNSEEEMSEQDYVYPREEETTDNGSNLGGKNTTYEAENSNGESKTRRWVHGMWKPRDEINPDVRIASGLGNTVEVLRANIPFDNGLIHLVEDWFTLPELLSTTAAINGYLKFLDLISETDQKDTLDQRPKMTFFIPSDKAFGDTCIPDNGKKEALADHVVPDFLGYASTLRNVTSVTNQNGNPLSIKVVDGEYFIEDAKVIKANVILDNGVAHVIDKVLFRNPSSSVTTVTVTAATGLATATSSSIAESSVSAPLSSSTNIPELSTSVASVEPTTVTTNDTGGMNVPKRFSLVLAILAASLHLF